MVGNLIGLEALLDDVQTAEILKVKATTLQQWRSRGTGPEFILVGDLPRYSRAALESYIAERTVTPTPRKKEEKPETTPKRKRGRPRGKAKK